MWPWPSIATPLLVLFSLSAAVSVSVPARAESTASGPTSASEAAILWKDANRAINDARFDDAIPLLQRLIARYPGHTGYLDAHRLLGLAWLRTDQPAKAIDPLKYFVLARAASVDGLRARLLLGDAYVRMGEFDEAELDCIEIENSRRAPKDVRAQGLILKARALIGLNHDDRARASVESAEKLASGGPLFGAARAVELELKARACARFPSARRLEEGQVQDQLSRRGLCLMEALIVYRDALSFADEPTAKQATTQIVDALNSYEIACQNPPDPPPLRPFDRDAEQKTRYRQELGAALEQDCKKRYKEAHEIVAEWKQSLPATSTSRVDEVLKTLDHLEGQ